MPSDYDLKLQGKQTHELRHCDDPSCCVGVLWGRCSRCGFIASIGTVCPNTEDFKPPATGKFMVTIRDAEVITSKLVEE